MGLADELVSAITSPNNGEERKSFFGLDLPEIDEYGLPTQDSVEYFVARVMYIDRHSTNGHLHLRPNDNQVWYGHSWIAETTDTLYRLAEWPYPIKPYQKELIWKKIREVLPVLSRDKYVLSDELIWNRKTGKLEKNSNKPNTI